MRAIPLLFAIGLLGACTPAEEPNSVSASPPTSFDTMEGAESLPDSALRHVVVFRFRPDATAAQIEEITEAFRALEGRIPGILAFEDGVNNSPEGLNQGFTHAFLLTFENAAARDAYLPHPEHVAFGELLDRLGVVEDVFVIDYQRNL